MRAVVSALLLVLGTGCSVGGLDADPVASRRPDPTYAVRASEVDAHRTPDGLATVRILLDEPTAGSGNASFDLLTFEPGAVVPPHVHAASTEILYVLEGTGSGLVGGEPVRVEPGVVLHIPPGTLHSFVNDGGEPVRAVQVYAPPGPEQRFRQWEPVDASP